MTTGTIRPVRNMGNSSYSTGDPWFDLLAAVAKQAVEDATDRRNPCPAAAQWLTSFFDGAGDWRRFVKQPCNQN